MAREITGTLFKRGPIYWCKFKYQRHTFSFSLKTEKHGHALHERQRQMVLRCAAMLDGSFNEKYGHSNSPVAEPINGKLPLSSVWQCYLDSVKRPDSGNSTLRQYQCQVEKFITWIKESRPELKYLSEVDHKVAEDFAKSLRSWASAGTFNKYITLLKLVFRTLLKESGITENPWIEIPNQKDRPNNRRAFTDGELTTIFTKADGELLTLCLLGYYTALRLGDACLLEWSEVSLNTRQITRVPLKTARTTGKCVVIPIHDDLFNHLVSLHEKATSQYVSPDMAAMYQRDTTKVSATLKAFFEKCDIRLHRAGTGAAPKSLDDNDAITVVKKRAVIEASFHSFRHSFVSRSSEQGMDPASIHAIVGWGNPQMEKIYNHVSQSHLQQGISRNRSVFGNTKTNEKALPVIDVVAMDNVSLVGLKKAVDAELKRRRKQLLLTHQVPKPAESLAIPA